SRFPQKAEQMLLYLGEVAKIPIEQQDARPSKVDLIRLAVAALLKKGDGLYERQARARPVSGKHMQIAVGKSQLRIQARNVELLADFSRAQKGRLAALNSRAAADCVVQSLAGQGKGDVLGMAMT